MELTISHTTRYTYDEPVNYALQKVRLRPSDNLLQQVLAWDVTVEHGTLELSYRDHLTNNTDLISTEKGAHELVISARGRVLTNDTSVGVLGKVYTTAPLWYYQQDTMRTQAGRGIKALAKSLSGDDLLGRLHDLSHQILDDVPYQGGQTNDKTAAEEALAIGAGVCQDHAQIFIAAARTAGLPARYVSGYLMLDDRIEQDASHGWAEVHLDSLGWVGFDISNGISPDGRYVRLAIGRDSKEAAPISGMRLGSGNESMIVSLQVQQ